MSSKHLSFNIAETKNIPKKLTLILFVLFNIRYIYSLKF